MAESKLNNEFEEIMIHIKNGDNFLLSGGAGSGKTYSLVEVIKQVIKDNPTEKVACMTYTNAAVKEIESRVDHKNLNVSTIHDFLWDNIKHFKKELKLALIELINDESVTKVKVGDNEKVLSNYFEAVKEIQYKEYLRLKEGIISHDELLILAEYLFKKYEKLCDILKDKYKFIFVDEYQDTHKEVIEIFLVHLTQSKKKSIIGFFGDVMQSIYDDRINNLNAYIGEEKCRVKEVKKVQNRRNPQKIITLSNKLRTDGLMQEPSTDLKAPNMKLGIVKEGNVKFFYSNSNDLDEVKKRLAWDFANTKETKELNLTHNLIASKAGFGNLIAIYDKDQIIKYRDRIKEYIKRTGISTDFSTYTLGEVIDYLKTGKSGTELNAVLPTNAMKTFIDNNQSLFNQAKTYNYSIFSKLYIHKDQLIDDKKQDEEDENRTGSKKDDLIKHLFKIQNNIFLYKSKRYNEFLRVTEYRARLTSIEEKRNLEKNINELVNVGDKTIEQIIEKADELGICVIEDKLNDFKRGKEYFYYRVKDVKFSEFQKLYDYLEGFTPFSTQHKIKGDEFDNVLVILDNGNWNNYNFQALFLGNGTPSVLERTQKIFYVCCTRAKENLAVFYQSPTPAVIAKAKDWFGEENIVNLDVVS